jgi:hypothetical protein
MVLVFPAVTKRVIDEVLIQRLAPLILTAALGVFAPARAQAKLPITFFLVPTMQEFHSALTELAVSA